MSELTTVLVEILEELRELNTIVDDIRGLGICNSVADVCEKLDGIKMSVDGIDVTIMTSNIY